MFLTVLVFRNSDSDGGFSITNNNRRSWRLSQPQESMLATAEEIYHRVSGLVVIPGLLREMDVDPAVILPRVGLETSALDHVETGFHMCRWAVYFTKVCWRRVCPHFGLLSYQRVRLSHLGVQAS